MKRTHANWSALFATCGASLAIAGCASSSGGGSTRAWTPSELSAALAAPTRPQADRARDADRKPAELMTFFGVERGMRALDLIASGGSMTDVLATTVGPSGKVYAQNPPRVPEVRRRQGFVRSRATRQDGSVHLEVA